MSQFERNESLDTSNRLSHPANNDNPVEQSLLRAHALSKQQAARSRRNSMRAAGLAGFFGSAALLVSLALNNRLQSPTEEQVVAKTALTNLPEDCLAHDLVVIEDGAKMRDKPNSSAEIDADPGSLIGNLSKGVTIPRAAVVNGNDPSKPMSADSTREWFTFENPKDSKTAVFSSSTNFDRTKFPDKACYIDLKK